jgi:hypothetical protein
MPPEINEPNIAPNGTNVVIIADHVSILLDFGLTIVVLIPFVHFFE